MARHDAVDTLVALSARGAPLHIRIEALRSLLTYRDDHRALSALIEATARDEPESIRTEAVRSLGGRTELSSALQLFRSLALRRKPPSSKRPTTPRNSTLRKLKTSFQNCVRYIPGVEVVYLVNPRVASSSILASMWQAHDARTGQSTFAGSPHARYPAPNPFVEDLGSLDGAEREAFLSLTFFSVVRNPYARAASAYLDKVARTASTDFVVRNRLASVGIDWEQTPTLKIFLEAVMRIDPRQLDWHFCPQHVNLLAAVLEPNFVGHLERMEETARYLGAHGVEFRKFMPHPWHATDADRQVKALIGPREAELIRRYYERDFTLYGYSEDPERIAPL